MRAVRVVSLILTFVLVPLGLTGGPTQREQQSSLALAAPQYQLFVPAVFPKGADPHAVLNELNRLRSWGNIPPVAENLAWNDGAVKHSRYMVMNQQIVHEEDPANRWYTPEGDAAGRNSDIIAYYSFDGTNEVDLLRILATGPFHMIGLIDPFLTTVGYGSYQDPKTGLIALTVDVLRGLDESSNPKVSFPLVWPADGATIDLDAYLGGEVPDPLAACPDNTVPTGLPFYIFDPAEADNPPPITTTLTVDGDDNPVCSFNALTFPSSTGIAQVPPRVAGIRASSAVGEARAALRMHHVSLVTIPRYRFGSWHDLPKGDPLPVHIRETVTSKFGSWASKPGSQPINVDYTPANFGSWHNN